MKPQYKSDVIFTGRLPIEELQQVTASAEALMYASVFEGFGVPMIEARHSTETTLRRALACLTSAPAT